MRSGYLTNLEKHSDLLADPLFAAAFTWLQANSNPVPQPDPYALVGEDVYARVIEYTPATPEQGKLETHHEYVDLQVCLGPLAERILIAHAPDLTSTEDIPDRDVKFYATPPNCGSHLLYPDSFIIFDTESDAHMPQRIAGVSSTPAEEEKIVNRKVVIKLRKSALTPNLKL